MILADAKEAAPIVQRLLHNLAKIIPDKGRPGCDARTAIGDTYAKAYTFLRNDILGEPLNNCFNLVQQAGATQPQFAAVRAQTKLENPKTLGATLARDLCINWCLAMEVICITQTAYASRGDVDKVIAALQPPFNDAEEVAADAMDQAVYAGLIALHAAINNYLVSTARQRPRLLAYRFANIMPSLVLSYRLYADASRADEIRAENHIVHPAFCPVAGYALSQ
jgi:prophage DNA circulation protein